MPITVTHCNVGTGSLGATSFHGLSNTQNHENTFHQAIMQGIQMRKYDKANTISIYLYCTLIELMFNSSLTRNLIRD